MTSFTCSNSRFGVMAGDAQMIELPDGSYLEIDCRDDDACIVTRWLDGDVHGSMFFSLD